MKMMMAFRPIGECARWRVVYGMLADAQIDDVLTYEQLADALGLDSRADRHAIQMAVRRAAIEHERADKRAVDAVKNVGYRVVQPPEHVMLARRHQAKSSRALVRGHSKAVNVDLSGLDDATRHALDVIAQGFAVQMEFNRRFDVRQRRLEQALSTVAGKASRSEEEIAELRRRLERLERPN